MSAHRLRISNPTGKPYMTTVELDGVMQMVNKVQFTATPNGMEVTLTYPHIEVEIDLPMVDDDDLVINGRMASVTAA